MPSLQEVYDRSVELFGEDSKGSKMFKIQLEAEKASKGESAESVFIAGVPSSTTTE